jgi:hypothetical protein
MPYSLRVRVLAVVAQVRVRVQEVSLSVPMTIRTRCFADSRKVLLLQRPQSHTLMVAVAVMAADQL